FIGAKLILHWAHEGLSRAVPQISTPVNLGVIVVVLAIVTVVSLSKTRHDPELKAHTRSLRSHRDSRRPDHGSLHTHIRPPRPTRTRLRPATRPDPRPAATPPPPRRPAPR